MSTSTGLARGRVVLTESLGRWWAGQRSGSDEVGPRRVDLRLVPVAAVGWVAGGLGTWASAGSSALAAASVAFLGLLALRRRSAWLAATALVVAVLTLLGGLQAQRLRTGPLAELARDGAVVTADLVVRGDPRMHPAQGSVPAYVTLDATLEGVSGRDRSWRLRAPVLVVGSGAGVSALRTVVVGSRLRVDGRLQAPDRGSSLAAVVRVRGQPRLLQAPGSGARAVERVREGLRTAVAGRRPEPRGLVPALVLGDTSRVEPDLVADFQATGLTHLTAVSGANLTLLLAFVLMGARWLGVRGWWLRVVGLMGVAVFIALCRTEPSVLRAAAMGLVALAALGAGGRAAGLRNLSVAMLGLLLMDPFLSRSLGFALSVLASAGIIWWARPWALVMNRWMPLVLAELVAVPLAAHLATVPVVAAISGQVSMSGLLANAAAGPFVGPATVLGFAAAGASLVSGGLAGVLGFGSAWSAQVIIWVAHAGAALPGSSWRWPVTPGAVVWLGVAALAAGLAMPYVLARRWLALAMAVLMTLALSGPPRQPGWPPRDWDLVACDIGQGDALVLHAGPGSAVVVDAGPDPVAIGSCLDQLRITQVPLLILTHFHADHVDGLPGVFEHREVGRVWVSPLAEPGDEVAEVLRLGSEHRASVESPRPGTQAQAGEIALSVLGPVPHLPTGEDDSSVQNDFSLVVRASIAGLRVLLTGDVEPAGQRAILATGADLGADVLKIPHHGSARQDRDFFAATHARVAIASAGVDNDYGHPAPRTVELARSLGMTVLHTDRDGAIAITGGPDRLAAVTQR